MPQVRLGPEQLGTAEEQQAKIEEVKLEVKEALADGRELICIDESTFNSKSAK